MDHDTEDKLKALTSKIGDVEDDLDQLQSLVREMLRAMADGKKDRLKRLAVEAAV